jgi:four helix bundle protein
MSAPATARRPPYERFDAWTATHALALAVYRATKAFPADERFGLTSQLRRAALSIPTNIAEGAAKRGSKDFGRFLNIALGSLSELTYLLRFARDLELLTHSDWERLEAQRDAAGKLTWGLYRAMH